MSQAHIRLTRTPEITNVLSFLRGKHPLMSEAEIIKMVLSEKYIQQTTRQFGTNIIDLETYPSMKDIQEQIRTPRKQANLLSMAGVFRGARDISRNKKKYS